VKTKDDIEKRLRKLRLRYAHKYVQHSQERRHCNCLYNEAHQPSSVPYTRTQSEERDVAPRHQVTLVVVRPEEPVRLCMYGAEDAAKWEGNVCDTDEVSRSCPMFRPRVSAAEAKDEFLESVADDELVFEKYRDVATLQWVLGERVHEIPLTWWDRLTLWFRVQLSKVVKPAPRLPPAELPKDIWDDPASNP